VRKLLRDLNKLYRQEAALHDFDFNAQGFRWIDCHDADQSALSFVRQGRQADDQVVVLLNFTPVPRHRYRIGVPRDGAYREILNTDSEYYGGSNCGNGGEILAQPQPWMGFEHSIEVTLPPLAGVFLKAAR
jgi:1,4-alpha-glucan branching enzyme